MNKFVDVAVEPFFLTKHFDNNQFIWAYRVIISNNSDYSVTIKSRYWYVIDIENDIKEVKGEGIIGECPTIIVGGVYEYMSGVSLYNPAGMMFGHYNVVNEHDDHFKVEIPPFVLDSKFHVPVYY